MTEIIGWRTRLSSGSEAAYERTHRRIPDPVAQALRSAGVISWRIWRDGTTLFHVIETTHGADAMGARMAEIGPIAPEWDDLIATMVDMDPAASADLSFVWGMDASTQMP